MAVSVANTSTVEETIASSGEPKLSATTPARRSSGGSLDDVERRGRCIVDAAPVALARLHSRCRTRRDSAGPATRTPGHLQRQIDADAGDAAGVTGEHLLCGFVLADSVDRRRRPDMVLLDPGLPERLVEHLDLTRDRPKTRWSAGAGWASLLAPGSLSHSGSSACSSYLLRTSLCATSLSAFRSATLRNWRFSSVYYF